MYLFRFDVMYSCTTLYYYLDTWLNNMLLLNSLYAYFLFIDFFYKQ